MKKILMLAMLLMVGICFMGVSSAIATDCMGTGTPGYWKNHPEAWPVTQVCLSNATCYSKEEAIAIMDGPVRGDKSITMFKAWVAAYLNVMNDACGVPDCDHWYYGDINLQEADQWLRQFPVGTEIRARSEAWQYSHGEAIYFCLDDYNNGLQPGSPSRDTMD